jgi:hypothetical protein
MKIEVQLNGDKKIIIPEKVYENLLRVFIKLSAKKTG